MQQLLIPDRINVGFNKRNDTYTTKLGYVIYYDQKGVLRKEKSWQGWRDQKIAPQEFKNEPIEGFVLNRSVGGYRSSWNYRSAKIRIYDPRDWEFEITLENLLFVLAVGDCSRGKGLEGKFVYAWEGTELVLLSVAAEEYQKSKNYTDLQVQSVKSKDLVPGITYITKKQQLLLFLGRFDWHFMVQPDYRSGYDNKLQKYNYNKKDLDGCIKRYVFWDQAAHEHDLKWKAKAVKTKAKALKRYKADLAAGETNGRGLHHYFYETENSYEDNDEMYDFYDSNTNVGFVYHDTPKNIAAVQTDTPHPKFAELVERFYKGEHGSKVVELFLKESPKKKVNEFDQVANEFDQLANRADGFIRWAIQLDDGSFVNLQTNFAHNTFDYNITYYQNRYFLKDGVLFEDHDCRGISSPKNQGYHKSNGKQYDWVEPTHNCIYAKMESGSEIMIDLSNNVFSRGR